MKKDRNSFFESSNFNMSAMGPNMNMNGMNMGGTNMGGMNMGMPSINAASSNFYAAQNMPMPMPNYPNFQGNGSTLTELESKLAKLERSINRLDARLTKLEGNSFSATTTYDSDGNMYMV